MADSEAPPEAVASRAGSKPRRAIPPLLKFLLDLGPVVAFFVVNFFFGIFAATAVFMPLVVAALAFDYWMERRLAPVPLFSAVFVLIMGGLTLWLAQPMFIKIKPTVFYVAAAALLIVGMRFNRLYIKALFGTAFDLNERAWRILTWRVAAYCATLAVLNEIVWRNFSTDIWAGFKVALIPLTFLFMAAQLPFIIKNQLEEKPPAGGSGREQQSG